LRDEETMRRGRVWFTPIAAIVVLALTRAHAASTIKLGVAGPLTGDQGAFGQELKNGVIIAVEEWNAKGVSSAKARDRLGR
jgi:ABC-type branched-subunit amino acid transport system substrate-binding protein